MFCSFLASNLLPKRVSQQDSGFEKKDEERAEILDALVGMKLNVIGVACFTAVGDGDGDAVHGDSCTDAFVSILSP